MSDVSVMDSPGSYVESCGTIVSSSSSSSNSSRGLFEGLTPGAKPLTGVEYKTEALRPTL